MSRRRAGYHTAIFDMACAMIPGRLGILVLISAFFDESYDGALGHGPLAVAGYAFSKGGLRKFNNSWKRMLKDYNLPFFECPHVIPAPIHLSILPRRNAMNARGAP